MKIKNKEIRAVYNEETIRVYQAYSDNIADSALKQGRFVSPPFKLTRMTWIKPSFLWMMYRAGWGQKDSGQKRILAIDISIEGFEWALEHSLISNHGAQNIDQKEWQKLKEKTPVRIQWDPERNLLLEAQEHRSIQIGLSNEAVDLYVNKWIQNITEVTEQSQEIQALVKINKLEDAKMLLPKERPYIPSKQLQEKISLTE